ncbi:MAG: hypothetical protein JW827_00745, partial [Spirochaetes bacterium]|nr:hypothetical protein [Spirochaetota bacterium]
MSNMEDKIKHFLKNFYFTGEKKEDCPDEEQLYAFFAEQMDDKERDKIIKHINTCQRCSEIISLLGQIEDDGS